MRRVNKRRRRISVALGVGFAALSLGAVMALADDTIFPDGDTGVASPNLKYGSDTPDHACNTRGTAVAGEILVNYNGGVTGSTHHFSAGEALTVSFVPEAGSGISAAVVGSPPSVPSDWDGNEDSFAIPFGTTVPASLADGSYAVEVTVTGQSSGYTAGDGAASPGKPRYQVLVGCGTTGGGGGGGGGGTNTAPSVAFSNPPSSATEGDVKTFNFTITDPDSASFTFAAGSPSCGSLGSISGTPSIDNSTKTGSFACLFPDGVIPALQSAVAVQVSDGTDLSNTATTNVTVNNANPLLGAISIPSATGTACIAGNQISLSFSFSDAGLDDDPWAIDVNWGDASAHATDSVSAQGPVGPYLHIYSAGSWTPSAKVTDKDGGIGTVSAATNAVQFLYSTGQGILQPINYTGPRSQFKVGSTIPVKIKITDCNGAPVSGLSPQVSLKYLDGSPDGSSVEDFYSTVPDQGTSMRFTGSPDYQYIYNLGTKGRAAGDYSVTVSDPTIAAVTAYFSMKK